MLWIKRKEKITDNHIKGEKGKTYMKGEMLEINRAMTLNLVDLTGTIYYLRESYFAGGTGASLASARKKA